MFKKSGAEAAVSAFDKIQGAIDTEKKRLIDAAGKLLAAQCALRQAEAAVALGEAQDAEAARKRLEAASSETARHGAVLGGLRLRLAALSPQITASYDETKSALPAHVERIKGDFVTEWGKCIGVLGRLMGKRSELERLIGKIELPDAHPEPCGVPDEVAAPWRALEGLHYRLDLIAAMQRSRVMADVDQMMPRARRFDGAGVYRIVNDRAGLQSGTLVVPGVLPDGELEHLFHIGYAVACDSELHGQSAEHASESVRRIDSERLQEYVESNVPNAEPLSQDVLDRSAEASRQQQRYVDPATCDPMRPEGVPVDKWRALGGGGGAATK